MTQLSPKRVARMFERSDLAFDHVLDRRAVAYRKKAAVLELAAMLRLMVLSIASGQRTLRAMEALSHEMMKGMRRRVGLKHKGVSDTALYEMLARTPVYGFRQALWHLLRTDLDRKALRNDAFPVGVVSYDGKAAGWGKGERPNRSCQLTFYGDGTIPGWKLYTLRSCLTSSHARPVIDQEFLPPLTGEATTFAALFQRDVAQFPRLFRIVTTDAGITSKGNADVVLQAAKHYLFAIKANAGHVYRQAQELLADAPIVAQTVDQERGYRVVRTLHCAAVTDAVNFPGATQVWRVCQVKTPRHGEILEKTRYFITSIPDPELSDDAKLKLVRLHWGIENGPNWTQDVILKEDDQCPCYRGSGLVVFSWLRLIAYNLLSVFRKTLPTIDRRPHPWMQTVSALVVALRSWEPMEVGLAEI